MRRHAEFSSAVRAGVRAGAPTLAVHFRPAQEPTEAPATVGFVVARTVGGAVVRNRVRRRLRHLMRERLGSLPPGARLVVRANAAAAGVPAPALAAQLDRSLARVLGLPAGTVLVETSGSGAPEPRP
jgi:ribonuclease P protein component